MFPCSMLEKLFEEYDPYAPETFSPEVLLSAAKLAEDWLMGFAGETHPEKRALECLVALGDIETIPA